MPTHVVATSRRDELHRVVDREAGVHRSARRVDVQLDVLVGILGLEMDHLSDDEVRDLVVDRRPEEDDALVQEPRVDVEEPLAARGLLDDGWDDRDSTGSCGSSASRGPEFRVGLGFSLSGVQIASRAAASSRGIRLTSEATRSSALRMRRSSRSARSGRARVAAAASSSASSASPRPARGRAPRAPRRARRCRASRPPPRARARARPTASPPRAGARAARPAPGRSSSRYVSSGTPRDST